MPPSASRAEQETRNLEITRTEVLEAAEIARRDKVERARITTELALEKERIASAEVRARCSASTRRGRWRSPRRSAPSRPPRGRVERADCGPGACAQAEISGAAGDREGRRRRGSAALEAARLERRTRARTARSVARNQALQEAEIAAREEVERARIASERGLDEARRRARPRPAQARGRARAALSRAAVMDKAIAIYREVAAEQSAAQVEAGDGAAPGRRRPRSACKHGARKRESPSGARTVEVMLAEEGGRGEAHRGRGRCASAPRSRRKRRRCSTRPRTRSPTRRATRCSGAACSTRSRASCARASSRWRRSRASASCMSTGSRAGDGGGFVARDATDEVIDSALRYRVQAPLIELRCCRKSGWRAAASAKLGGLMREAQRPAGRWQGSPRRVPQRPKAAATSRPAGGRSRRSQARPAGRRIVRRLGRRE